MSWVNCKEEDHIFVFLTPMPILSLSSKVYSIILDATFVFPCSDEHLLVIVTLTTYLV